MLYLSYDDGLSKFYEETCILAESARIKPSVLYRGYLRFCGRVRLANRLGSKSFYQRVRVQFKQISIMGSRHYIGIGLIG